MEIPAQQLLIWGLLWGLAGGLFALLVRRGINYVDGFALTAILFLGLSVLAGFMFRHLLWPRLAELGPMHAGLLVVLLGGQSLAYVLANRYLRRPTRFMREHPHIYFLRLDHRYLISKSFEILFQQVLVASLVLMLAQAGLSRGGLVAICALIFSAAHLPLLALFGRFFGLFYVVSAAVGGAAFSMLILSTPDGLFFSYVIHWLYYTVSGLAFWLILGWKAADPEPGVPPRPSLI